ncbi:MAG: response regulator transcription factor [Desulfobacterales bacterium]|nr:response regulator transcription factor [Desulfobacterales bacterium]
MSQKTIVIVDDHPVVRSGVKALIEEGRSDYKVVGEADDGKQGILLAKKFKPDIVIVDMKLPDMDGIRLTEELLKVLKNTRVMIFSGYGSIHNVKASMNAGALAYLVKGAEVDILYRCLDSVTKGRRFIDPSLSDKMYDLMEPSPHNASIYKYENLTPREQEILGLIATGLSLKDIAGRLCISYKTVANHRTEMMKRLGIKNIVELIRYADDSGLTD